MRDSSGHRIFQARNTVRDSIMPEDLPDRIGDQNIANAVAVLMEGPRQRPSVTS